MDQISTKREECYEIIVINGKSYRRLKPSLVDTKKTSSSSSNSMASFKSNISEDNDEPDTCKVDFDFLKSDTPSVDEISFDIKKDGNNFTFELEGNPSHFSAVIGPKGSTVSKIRTETGCNIRVPDRSEGKRHIFFKGPSEQALISAIVAVQEILSAQTEHSKQARPQKPGFDYFISIPLIDPNFSEQVKSLHEDIKALEQRGDLTIDNRSLLSVSTLHLTLTMLSLHSAERVEQASSLLKELSPVIYDMVGTQSLVIDWSSLKSIQEDVKRSEVIYLEPGPISAKILQPLADMIKTKFLEAGFGGDEKYGKVLLHATLVNTKMASRNGPKGPIDATEILKLDPMRFKPLKVTEIHLSQRFHYDENGYYHCAAKVNLP